MSRTYATLAALLLTMAPPPAPEPMTPDPNTPCPIDAVNSVFLEELTWMEVRDAMRAGKDTVIVATGGMEQNGPYYAGAKIAQLP
jgi:creatinine amidohydrolase